MLAPNNGDHSQIAVERITTVPEMSERFDQSTVKSEKQNQANGERPDE